MGLGLRKSGMWCVAVLFMLAGPALAARTEEAVRKTTELSLLVKGHVEVDAAGTVRNYRIELPERIPPPVRDAIARLVPAWRFEPVLRGGKPVEAATDMRLRFVAKQRDDGGFQLHLRSAAFGSASAKPSEQVRRRTMRAPDYPFEAIRNGVTGTVYVLVKVGADGGVIDSVAEQVNLEVVAPEPDMERWRKVLSRSALNASRRWKFTPPTEGEDALKSHWILRVPVVFGVDEEPRSEYGEWQIYVPGPRRPNPWGKDDREGLAFGPDALAPGELHQAGVSLRLVGGFDGG